MREALAGPAAMFFPIGPTGAGFKAQLPPTVVLESVEGIMSGALPIPVRSLSVMAAVLVASLSAICFLDAARAEDCLAAPNGPAPQGSHWYYRIDRAKQRKCWYVHAIMTSAARTGELPRASATAPVVDSKLPAAAPAQSADLPPDVPLAASDADRRRMSRFWRSSQNRR